MKVWIRLKGVTNFNFVLIKLAKMKYKHQAPICILYQLFLKNSLSDEKWIMISRAKIPVNELKNYMKIGGLKISGNKNELVARVFFCYGE